MALVAGQLRPGRGPKVMIPHTPVGAIAAFDPVEIVANIYLGIPLDPIAAGEVGDLAVRGGTIFGIAAGNYTIGSAVYWDDSAGKLTTTATTNPFVGYLVTASTTDNEVEVDFVGRGALSGATT